MGIDMATMGSAVQLTMSEDELLAIAKQNLDGVDLSENYRAPRPEDIAATQTLGELFWCFRQNLMRGANGEVAAFAGYDDRLHEPDALFAAVADGIRPGSWYAWRTDNDLGTYSLAAYTPNGVNVHGLLYEDRQWDSVAAQPKRVAGALNGVALAPSVDLESLTPDPAGERLVY